MTVSLEKLWHRVDKRALVVTAGCLVGWRVLNQIPVVDIGHAFIATRLGLYNLPGSVPAIGSHSILFEAYSLNHFGIASYVQVLVGASLLTLVSDRFRALVRSPVGQRQLERWMRVAALLVSGFNAYGWTSFAQNGGALPPGIDWFVRLDVSLEMAAGTGVMILLASLLDEHGLGFGYGAIIFYALDILADGLHRVADYIAYTPSLEALYRPLAVWAAFTLAITVAGVAMFLAYRHVWIRLDDEEEPSAFDLKLVMPGILRPGLMTFALLNLPFVLYQYAGPNPTPLRWFLDNWSPYGSPPWLDAIYIVVEAALLIVFAVGAVWVDWTVNDLPWSLQPNGLRLAAISGVVLAVLIAVGRPASYQATRAAGQIIVVSGFDVLLVACVVMLVVLNIEGRRHPLVTTEALLP